MPTLEDPQNPSPGEPDPFEGLVLDEDFVRGAKQKEGSARARMLASKWRQEPPRDTSWRPDPTPRRRWYQRAPKAFTTAPGRRRLGGRWQAPLAVLLAVLLVAAGTNPLAVKNWFVRQFGGHSPAQPAAAAVPSPSLQAPETAPPTAAPTTPPGTATATAPFAGSPAADWPEGAAAIVVPEAHAVGVYDSATVASYLQHAKDFLVDSNLDPSVLAGGYPTAAIGLLDPQDTRLRSLLKQELAHPSAKGDGTDFFSRFNPDQARLDGSVVKVQGELTFRGDGHGGLLIHADYTFVYPLLPGPQPAAPASPAPASWTTGATGTTGSGGSAGTDLDVARSIVRRIVDFDVPDATGYQHTPGTLWPTMWQQEIANSACGVFDGYITPQFPGSAPTGPAPSGSPVDPYDRSSVPPTQGDGDCGTVTRT